MWHRWVFWLILALTVAAIGSRALEEYNGSLAWVLGTLLSISIGVAINAFIMYMAWLIFKGVKALAKRGG